MSGSKVTLSPYGIDNYKVAHMCKSRALTGQSTTSKCLIESIIHPLMLSYAHPSFPVVYCHAWQQRSIQSTADHRRASCPFIRLKMNRDELQDILRKVWQGNTCISKW